MDALVRWHREQLVALARSSGSGGSILWQSDVLQLAFWHAVHRVLAPLPPGALPARDVPALLDAAFDALLPDGSPGSAHASSSHVGAPKPAPRWERWARAPARRRRRARGRDHGRRRRGLLRGPGPARPEPRRARELAARCLGLASRHDPDLCVDRFVAELEPRVNAEATRPEAHRVIHGARYLHAWLGDPGAGEWDASRASDARARARAAAAASAAAAPRRGR